MGLFSKLKANMNHGGVKVQLQVPEAVPSNQLIPARITLVADSPQQVASVKVALKARMREQGMTFEKSGPGLQSTTTTEQTVAVAESRQALSLVPGQPQTVDLQLFMSGNTSAMGVLGGMGNAGGALGGILQTAMAATQGFNHMNFIYTVHASVDVEGIALDPSDKQPIQILPPTEAVQPTINAPVQPTSFTADPGPVVPQPSQPDVPVQPQQ